MATDPQPTPTPTPPPTPPQADKPTLLIVDDEAGPRESLRIVFKDRYRCAIATCGNDGIEFARNNRVDAAILDIKMPDISGVEVLREIKKIDPDTECIMLTGYETLETARAAVRYGASDYLNKPFDVFSVRELLEKCISRRLRKRAVEYNLRTLQQMNEELTKELAHSNRAIAAGVLSAGVVHDINNPLSIISGYTQLLSRDLATLDSGDGAVSQQVQQRLSSIQREIDRCKEITKRFLNFSRTTQDGEELIEVVKMLEDAAALVRAHPTNRGVEIHCAASNPSPRVKVHPTEIMQVLINLGVNALQAMNGAGKLRFAVEETVPQLSDHALRAETYTPQKRYARITVADSGSGIAPENLKKIFQPYFTTKTQGTGLGLAIVCELIRKYEGAIDVESTVGQGTSFSVYLPLAD